MSRRDVLIVGGGPVGAALAVLLADTGLSVSILEAREVDADDPRAIALSYGSARLLQRIGAWEHALPRTPIDSVHVSQAGGWGRTRLTAQEQRLPALGYVVAYGSVHAALARRVQELPGIELRTGVPVRALDALADAATLSVDAGGTAETLQARLVVLADGGRISSALVEQRERDYGQSAVVADVACDLPHGGRAYERFSPRGPIALLPSGEGYALVWTVETAAAAQLAALPDAAFVEALQDAFGERAGCFVRCGARSVFPLRLRMAQAPRMPRVVLLGNAAQTLHPVAGQGLNLGLRDAQALAATLAETAQSLDDGQFAQRFHRLRRADRLVTAGITDSLVRLFSNDLAPLRALRGCGLTLLDLLPPAKRAFAQRMTFGG